MSKGILLFAFNTPRVDYFSMAVATAKRAQKFLGLPVSVVTDETTILSDYDYKFDNVFITESDNSNTRKGLKKGSEVWINKGRYQAYELSPYDETILLDTDYMINSDKLLLLFELRNNFACHNSTSFLMIPDSVEEKISNIGPVTTWATVIFFRKSVKAKQIFDCMKMVQYNYSHYVALHKMIGLQFRNDHALTLALDMVNGHTIDKSDYIPWNLLHVNMNSVYTLMYRNTDTEYVAIADVWKNNKIKKEYIIVKDTDFHMINKENFMELVDE
jgi:hypothetical protein